ncbi:MAG: polysaccharide biosynthesis tyrosine autokinase [Gemmatimonadales bacterium]
MVTGGRPSSAVKHSPLGDIHLKDIWVVIVRHWFLVLLITGLVAGGAAFTGRDAIPQYRSTLTLQVTSSKTAFGRMDDIDVDPVALLTDPVLSEALILSTQALARAVVDHLALRVAVDDPAIPRGNVMANVVVDSSAVLAPFSIVHQAGGEGWSLLNGSGSTIATGTYGARAQGPGFAFDVLPKGQGPGTVGFRIVHRDEAAGWVRAGLSYQVRQATSAFDVSFVGTDPSLVPFVLNGAASQLRIDGVQRLSAAIGRRAEFIRDAMDSTERGLRFVLDTIQRFKETRNVTDLTAEEGALVQTIAAVDRDRLGVRVRISTLESAIEAGTENLPALNRLAAVDAVQFNAALAFQINRLLNLYEERRSLTAGAFGLGSDNPQVQTLEAEITDAHTALAEAARTALEALHRRDSALGDNVAELRHQLSGYADAGNELARIEISASTLQETARWLRAQHQLVQLQQASLGPYVTVLDGASRPVRIGTSLQQKVFLGVFVGLLIGIGGAFFLEYLDQTIKTSADVERVLHTPVLGQIPYELALSGGRRGSNRIVTTTELPHDDPATEAFRALRTNITFVGAERPLQLIVVSSPGPGEGKTTITANLALTLANAGSRTVLIDGDLRRPTQHRAFGIVQEPGLTDVLVGDAKLVEVIRLDLADNLDVVPAGKIPPNPSELLGSDAMRGVLDDLRKDYEYIIMDSPPVLPVTDAVIAAASSDATVIVLRSGETEEVAALRAFEQLDRVKARVAGVVLNGLTPRFDHHYAYYTYGGYGERGRSKRSLLSAIGKRSPSLTRDRA